MEITFSPESRPRPPPPTGPILIRWRRQWLELAVSVVGKADWRQSPMSVTSESRCEFTRLRKMLYSIDFCLKRLARFRLDTVGGVGMLRQTVPGSFFQVIHC